MIVAALEQKILKSAEIDLIFEALQQWEFIELELKESLLQNIIRQKMEIFDPQIPIARDDSALISQLDMDALCLSMVLKVKRQLYELSIEEEEKRRITS